MCGVTATIGRPDDQAVKVMLDRVEHRGHDGSATWSSLDGAAAIGCARLAIVGGPDGGQPLTDETGTIHVVGNAEIYNHVELRTELGTRFLTGCDVEVIAHAWRRWGAACLDRLHGMFAFVLHDERTGGWAAARDRHGVKPLWCTNSGPPAPGTPMGEQWWLASEAQALYALRAYGVDPAEIRRVPSGHYATRTGLHRWHTPTLHPGTTPVDPPLTRHVLASAVRRHLMADADVTPCTFLSGGIDSSAVTALAAAEIPDLTAYTIGIPGRSSDIEAATAVMEHLRRRHPALRHVIVPFDPDLAWSQVPWAVKAACHYNPMIIEELLVQRQLATAAASDGHTVAETGEGFDELFGGYGVWDGLDPATARLEMLAALAQIGDTEAYRLDMATMHSEAGPIEARTPGITDPYLVDHVLGLPTWALLHPNGTRKWIIREAMRPDLPDKIVDRDKVTFGQGADEELTLIARMAGACDDDEVARLRRTHPDAQIRSRAQGYLYRLFHQYYGIPGRRAVIGGRRVFEQHGSYPALDRAILTDDRHVHGGTGERATAARIAALAHR